MTSYPFVIVSNRLPVKITKERGKLVFNRSDGGLPTAMASLDIPNKIWIGWPGIASDDLTSAEKRQITTELAKFNCYPVHQTKEEIVNYYEGYANDTLWPMMHYFPSLAQYREKYWQSYVKMNQRFAHVIKKFAAPDAHVWIHDYHLMLTPTYTRALLPGVKIGYFHHVPFPSYEIFRLIPERSELMKGLLDADLVGFHIYDYARHFISSSMHLIGTSSNNGVIEYNGREVTVDAFPIGVDYDLWQSQSKSNETKEDIARLDEVYRGVKVIVSVDRLDYSKGILKRLLAYERFLSKYPKYIRKVVLVMIATPSRTEVEAYKHLRDEIEITVSRINGMYSTGDWTPISYQFQNLGFRELAALYGKADVALVTPLRDGMNLVAKEYIASKLKGKGVLILSEMAGAADELLDALIVNPNDIPALSRSIYTALTMSSSEQIKRLEAMKERISSYTVNVWGQDFLSRLTAISDEIESSSSHKLLSQEAADVFADFKKATAKLLILDYDGTLKQYSDNIGAESGKPSPEIKAQLRKISSRADSTLAIVSGRPKAMFDAWFHDCPDIVIAAEHGAWIRTGGTWQKQGKTYDTSRALQVMHEYATRTPGAIVEQKDSSVVWHYRRVAPELAYVRTQALKRELQTLVDDTPLDIFSSYKTLEIKPRAFTKGAVATELFATTRPDFILCAGDGVTDEDMFDALPSSAITIRIGAGASHARYKVASLDDILRLIQTISKIK